MPFYPGKPLFPTGVSLVFMPFVPDPSNSPGWSTQQTMQPLVFRVSLR
jgi:hypothetical protein